MKLSKRAMGLLWEADPRSVWRDGRIAADFDPASLPRALVALVSLAAENPGLEWCNYATGDHRASLAAYRGDARTCQRGLAAVRKAVQGMRYVGATDADYFAACADGGRVELTRRDDGAVSAHYCAGQYYPTEYRHAIARVIERAGRIAYARQVRETAAARASAPPADLGAAGAGGYQ